MLDQYSGDLFASSKYKLLKFDATTIPYRDKSLLTKVLAQHEDYYPDILKWIERKVIPGIINGSRIGYICLLNERPVAAAVLKLEERAKFCHLHIENRHQEKHLGNLFFTLMTLDAKRNATEIHFTLPESLWEEKKEFFKSFGFGRAELSGRQYRVGNPELWCTAPFTTVWENSLLKIPSIIKSITPSDNSIYSGIVMSIRPEFVDKLFIGEKTIELRKKFNKKWEGCKVAIYSTAPISGIYGYATIDSVEVSSPDHVWDRYADDLGCNKKEYINYVGNSDSVYAIRLGNLEPLRAPVSLSQLNHLLRMNINPPQSYLSLNKSATWSQAVSITEMLHGRFEVHSSTFILEKGEKLKRYRMGG